MTHKNKISSIVILPLLFIIFDNLFLPFDVIQLELSSDKANNDVQRGRKADKNLSSSLLFFSHGRNFLSNRFFFLYFFFHTPHGDTYCLFCCLVIYDCHNRSSDEAVAIGLRPVRKSVLLTCKKTSTAITFFRSELDGN